MINDDSEENLYGCLKTKLIKDNFECLIFNIGAWRSNIGRCILYINVKNSLNLDYNIKIKLIITIFEFSILEHEAQILVAPYDIKQIC